MSSYWDKTDNAPRKRLNHWPWTKADLMDEYDDSEARALELVEQWKCPHNRMVENDDPKFVWKCADCGYVYGLIV